MKSLFTPYNSKASSDVYLFDSEFPVDERLPRHLLVILEPVTIAGQKRIRMLIDGVQVGDALSDNAHNDDGYRFHDVFHLGCAAQLGWSPVTRKIFSRKRKSRPQIDEVEDGGRATAIEEGICALVFSYAIDHQYLDGMDHIDPRIIETIKGMTRGLEISVITQQEWETAIFAIYKVWRGLIKDGGGTVVLDLESRKIALA